MQLIVNLMVLFVPFTTVACFVSCLQKALPSGVVFKHLRSWSPRRAPKARTMLRFLPKVPEAVQQVVKVNGDQKEHRRRGWCFDTILLALQLRGRAHRERRPQWLCQSDGWEWHHWTVGSTGNCGSWGIQWWCRKRSQSALWTTCPSGDRDTSGRGGLWPERVSVAQEVTSWWCTDTDTVSRSDCKQFQF